MRKVYLESTARREAKRILLENACFVRRTELLSIAEALGRVTSEAVFASVSMPGYPAAAMDGIAVRAKDTFGASDQKPLILKQDSYLEVDTGDPIPEPFEAVIKIEDVQLFADGSVELLNPVAPGQYIRGVGEDVVAGEMIIPANHLLTPPDLAVLLAGGHTKVCVWVRPRVTVIPTGDELIGSGSKPGWGEIIEFNGTAISGYLQHWGARPVLHPIVKDRIESLKQAAEEALENSDLVIINGGSSAGREDYTVQVVQSLGQVLVHGVNTKPGKPVILGIASGKPMIGLPGYPVSAYLALEWFVRPLIFRYLNQAEPERPRLRVTMGRRIISSMGSEEFIPVTVGYIGNKYIANPLNRGSGVTMSLVRAHGLLIIPAEALGLEEGSEAEIELFKPEHTLRGALVAVGSHDIALDLLASALRERDSNLSLSSSHVGSMGGITAILKGEAHIAGIHLFDAETGEYNLPYITRFLPDKDVVLVNLAYRMQGWIVPKGNPEGLKTVKDIVEKGCSFINRQKGAGTRLLFDYLLQQEGLSKDSVYGYSREEYSHLNVAAAVAAGTAHVGLGILSASQAYELDFIPVKEERYDLLMTREFYKSPYGCVLLEVICGQKFKTEVEALGGYSLRDVGRIWGINE